MLISNFKPSLKALLIKMMPKKKKKKDDANPTSPFFACYLLSNTLLQLWYTVSTFL